MAIKKDTILAAIDRLKDKIRLHPDQRRSLLLEIAKLYEKAKLYQPATKTLTYVIKEHPLDLKALLMLARMWIHRREYIRAIQIYNTLEKTLPRLTEAYLGQYACWKRLGRLEAATGALHRLLSLNPNELRVRELLVDLLEEGGRLEQASDEVASLITHHPKPGSSHFEWAARLALNTGRSTEAIAHLRHALDIDPSRSESWMHLAKAYEKREDWGGVREAASALLELHPSKLEGHRLLGKACLELGEWDRALLALERAGEGKGGDKEIRRLTAEALFRSGDYRDARDLFSQIAREQPWDGEIHLRLAQIALEKKEGKVALRQLRRAIHLSPDLAPAYLLLGELHLAQEEHQLALTVLQKLLLLRPRNLKMHLSLGMVHRHLRHEPKSRHHLRVASDLAPNMPEAWLELARLHRDFSRPALARGLFQRAIGMVKKRSPLYTVASRELEQMEEAILESKRLGERPLLSAVGDGTTPRRPIGKKARWRKL